MNGSNVANILRIYCNVASPSGPSGQGPEADCQFTIQLCSSNGMKEAAAGFCPRCSRRRCQVTPDHLITVLVMLLLSCLAKTTNRLHGIKEDNKSQSMDVISVRYGAL